MLQDTIAYKESQKILFVAHRTQSTTVFEAHWGHGSSPEERPASEKSVSFYDKSQR
jgi:hypothetical protein